MNFNRITWKKIWWYFISLITSLLLIFAVWNYSLVVGWIIGIMLVFINNFFNQIFLKKITLKNRRYLFWLAFFKTTIFWIISGSLLISIIMINKIVQGKSLWTKNLEVVFYPINLFTLLSGFIIMKFYPLTLIKTE